MASHVLSLEVPSVSNPAILKIFDLSVYESTISVVCPRLWVTVPGFQTSADILETRLVEGFSLSLTACDLDIQTANCDSVFNDLPDGVYAIRFAVSPHEYVYVDYNHLRITKAMKSISDLLCELDLADCISSKEKDDKLTKIIKAESYLKAAKAKVEICHEATKGMAIYDRALKMISKLDCKHC